MWVYDKNKDLNKRTYLCTKASMKKNKKTFERRIHLSENPLSPDLEKFACITKIPITFPGLDSTIFKISYHSHVFNDHEPVPTECFFKQKTDKLLTQWLY